MAFCMNLHTHTQLQCALTADTCRVNYMANECEELAAADSTSAGVPIIGWFIVSVSHVTVLLLCSVLSHYTYTLRVAHIVV
jgi:hypothetical protein